MVPPLEKEETCQETHGVSEMLMVQCNNRGNLQRTKETKQFKSHLNNFLFFSIVILGCSVSPHLNSEGIFILPQWGPGVGNVLSFNFQYLLNYLLPQSVIDLVFIALGCDNL